MAKELPYFKFEISEWMFGRIQKQPEEMQGMFINLCCKYWHKLGEYQLEDACLDFGADRIKILIDNRLIGSDEKYIFIKFLDIQLDECAQLSKKNRIKGLKSAEIRAKRKQQLTVVEPRLTTVQPNSTEEKRREEKRGEEIYTSRINAFEEISTNYIDIQNSTSILSNKGWASVQEKDVQALLFHFLESKADLDNDKKDVRQHFKNWLNKENLEEMIKLTVNIHANQRRKQGQQT